MMELLNYPVTTGIIAINILIFALVNLKKLDIEQLGSSYMTTIQNKQVYRVVTSAFTQREVMHLVCNMYSLYNIGCAMEHILYSGLYALCYGLIMIAGGLLSARIHKKEAPFTYSIGASGVICGLLGIYMVIAFTVFGFSGLKSLVPTIVLLVAMTASKKIDSIGHFTGLLVGVLCGIVLVSVFRFG
ncbi:rhomboid family intramembrane serine protease [Butyrivibrio sp. DSM 10294]|uniref:rhomboid family intramembrane serine protease n=1 Tax=Butyrivibrio sp. DSM 10294 TaxID=2972457 RepID=UPI00234F1C2F|nr:rhomboid family intramembrane serine protease [Butyrivibrio sp. DSM 10294]MDC7293025.1 rhomboid family intramembrane serine protease [Butyrivibrio sp. DSM 10294]